MYKQTFPNMVPVFPRINSMQSGLRFWGIKLLPVEYLSANLMKLNS